MSDDNTIDRPPLWHLELTADEADEDLFRYLSAPIERISSPTHTLSICYEGEPVISATEARTVEIHQPTLERLVALLADLNELDRYRAIVRDIAARDHPGVLLSNDLESNFCCYCLAHLGAGDDHRDSCAWRRARELLGDSG